MKCNAILLTAVMLLAMFAGCSNDSQDNQGGDTEQSGNPAINTSAGISAGATVMDDYIYVPKHIPLPSHIGEISKLAYFANDDKAYFVASQSEQTAEENDYNSSGSDKIYSIHLNGSQLTELANYRPPAAKKDKTSGWTRINAITFDGDGNIWVAESWSFYAVDLPASFNADNDDWREFAQTYDSGNIVRKLDAKDGSELYRLELDSIEEQQNIRLHADAIAISSKMDEDSDELIYLSHTDYFNDTAAGLINVYVLDSNGSLLTSHSIDGMYPEFVTLPDGQIIFSASYQDERELWNYIRTLHTIDVSSKTLDIAAQFPPFVWQDFPDSRTTAILAGNNEFDIFVNIDGGLVGYTQENPDAVKLMNWLDSNVISNTLEDIVAISDEQFLVLSTAWSPPPQSGQSDAALIVLTRTQRSEVPEKTVLTLAAY